MIVPHDIPPTAGLPLQWRDFLPCGGDFASELAQRLNIPIPIFTASGTSALVVALRTLAEGSARDEVIVPLYTCPLVALAIVHAGLKPICCDTAPAHFDFDFDKLHTLANTQTLAIISTHLGGQVADVSRARAIAQRVGAYVIEDAAQALGARSEDGNAVGLAGDVGFFSLAVGKGLTTFEGGVLFSAQPTVHQRLRQTVLALLPHNLRWEMRRSIELLAYAMTYRPSLLPYVYGNAYRRAVAQGDWLTALGEHFDRPIPMHNLGLWRQRRALSALNRLPVFLETTRETALQRCTLLNAIPGITVLGDRANTQGVWPFLMLLLPTRAQRDQAIELLTPLRFGVSRLYTSSLDGYPYLVPHLGIANQRTEKLTNAHNFSDRLLTISNSPWLSDAAFEQIANTLRTLLQSPPANVG